MAPSSVLNFDPPGFNCGVAGTFRLSQDFCFHSFSNLDFCSGREVDRLVGDVDDVGLVGGKLAFNATFLQGPVLT